MSENGLWVRLGSGKTEQFGVHGIAALLDKAVRAGLNVPNGVVILDTVWDQAILRGLLLVGHSKLDIPSPERLVAFLNLPQFDHRLTMQPAFSNRRSASEEQHFLQANVFADILENLTVDDAFQMAGALSKIWTTAIRYLAVETGAMPRVVDTGELPPVRPPSNRRSTDEISLGQFVRRDVLLIETVPSKVRGIAYTQQAYEDDLILFQSNDKLDQAYRLVIESEDACETLLLPKLRGWERQSALKQATPVEWSARLQELLREVRRWVGQQKHTDWKIEWADDGSKCWLLWMEPIKTPPPSRHETLIPATPVHFALGQPYTSLLVPACEDKLTAYFRRFDPGFARVRPLYTTQDNRQQFNVGLIAEFLRSFGLSTRRLGMIYDLPAEETSAALKYPINRRRILVKTLRLSLPAFWLSQIQLAWVIHRKATDIIIRAENEALKLDELPPIFEQFYLAYITQIVTFERLFTPIVAIAHRLGKTEFRSPRQALKQAVQIVAKNLAPPPSDATTDDGDA